MRKFNNKFLKVKISNKKPKIQDEIKEEMKIIDAESGAKKVDVQFDFKSLLKSLIKLQGYYIYPKQNSPECREQFAFKYDYTDIVLFGGLASNKNTSVWTLDLEDVIWKKHDPNLELNANQLISPRYGHTGVLYQKKFYIFGGKTKSNTFQGCGDLEIYSVQDNKWIVPSVYTKSYLKLRKNHVSELVGNHMFVHGGISDEGDYLNDSYLLTFSPIKWKKCEIKRGLNDEDKSPYLSGHSCCLVVSDEFNNNKLNIYNIPLLKTGSKIQSRVSI